jgi:hypothetical protein
MDYQREGKSKFFGEKNEFEMDYQRKKNILKTFEKDVMGLKWIAIEE